MGRCQDCWLSGDRMWQIFRNPRGKKKKKKKVPSDPGGTSQRVVCQLLNTGDLKRSANSHTHIGSYRVLGHEGEGEKDKNGFPVLPELAAANLKLTAAM